MVTTPLRIGVTGAHSTGKTLLLRRIEMELRSHGIQVARTGGLGRRAAALGLPKMHHHTAASTEWVIAQGIADEAAAAQQADVVLVDRAVMDALAYWHAALDYRGETADPGDDERLGLLAATQHHKYHLLLATVLDPTAPIAEQRHTYDPAYRALVDHHVHQLLAEDNLDHLQVTRDAQDQAHAVEQAVRLALTTTATTAHQGTDV